MTVLTAGAIGGSIVAVAIIIVIIVVVIIRKSKYTLLVLGLL